MTRSGRATAVASLTAAAIIAAGAAARAHSGPPFPLVQDRVAGPYRVSIWTDPDTTDDDTPGGQFWLVIEPAAPGTTLPPSTRAIVSISPLSRSGPTRTGRTEITARNPARQFVALPMDHEGPFQVTAAIEGPLGPGSVAAQVDATYDLRPPPIMIVVYLMPFALVGALWVMLLVRRRRAAITASGRS